MSASGIDVQPPDAPTTDEFATELIGQLLGDLDGVLFAGDAPIDDTCAALYDAAAQGRLRGATLALLARAALSAHAALLYDFAEESPVPTASAVSDLIRALLPHNSCDVTALLAAETRLQQYVSVAEPNRSALWNALAQAIHHLYDGMRSGDDHLSSRGLLELRSMVVHLDATACALADESQLPPRRVIRPDRFHDLFIGYLEAVRAGDNAQQPVATLQQGGRIAALVTTAAHPVQVAEQSLRESLADDPIVADDALARIRALILFLDQLRRHPHPRLGPVEDQTLQLSLITAAAIAPLRSNGRYAFGELAQVALYNQRLLRAQQIEPARAH